ncbi:MAG: hypothetical protein RIC36_16630 [Rhodospirillales bacterium]
MNVNNSGELITVKDIADLIAFDRTDQGVSRTMRQLRHWTENDLIRTCSEKKTGKGIPRLYEEQPTLEIATVLLELSRYGANIDILQHVSKELYEHWDGDGGLYILQTETENNSYIQVSWEIDPETGKFIGANVHMFDDFDEEADSLNRLSTSSILINMTTLMDSVYARREA